ncbi:MAG TPA: MarP family serine protease [Solirubrobacteraceae bacterium]|nr:MarP family serine protease [Solirubrobacteraceae bacterium]
MTPLDFIIIAFAAFFALVGFARGFLIGALSLAGFAAGAYLGTRFGPHLLSEGNASPFAPLFGLLGALIGGTLLSAGAEGIGGAMRAGMVSPAARGIDGILGSILAIALALGIAWLLSVIVLQTPGIRDYRRTIQKSAILQELNEVLPSDQVLKALARFDPFPTINGPGANVPAPRGSVARDPDIQRAGDSVVQILGNSCGLGVSGSGWVAARGIVVTNAHVVAGQDSGDTVVRRRDRGQRFDARAIAFDSRNDIAVLRVPDLPSPSLDFAREVKVTEPGAVLGYPLSGPFDIRAARVGATRTTLTQDAYGRRLVRRKIVAFRGDVQPGNSGGPIIDVAGRVSATVFAKSTSGGAEGGFAIPNDIVRDILARADGPVGTGPCTR